MKKIIVITGSGRGIGAAAAIKAASLGYDVCVNYLKNHEAANKTVDAIKKKGGNAIAVQANVSEEKGVQTLFETVDKELGKLNALVNNAGIVGNKIRIEEIDLARLGKMFMTNIASQFLCAREAIKRMSTAKGGKGGAIVAFCMLIWSQIKRPLSPPILEKKEEHKAIAVKPAG